MELDIKKTGKLKNHSWFFITIAVTLIAAPKKDSITKEIFRLVSPATNPIKGGPTKRPIINIEDTAAMATGGGNILNFPAALKTNGMAGDTPTPTRNIPMVAGTIKGNKTVINKPAAVEIPQRSITFLNPM